MVGEHLLLGKHWALLELRVDGDLCHVLVSSDDKDDFEKQLVHLMERRGGADLLLDNVTKYFYKNMKCFDNDDDGDAPLCPQCAKPGTPKQDVEDGVKYTVLYWCDDCDVVCEGTLNDRMTPDGWRSCVHAAHAAKNIMEVLRDAEGFPTVLADDIVKRLVRINRLLYEGMPP